MSSKLNYSSKQFMKYDKLNTKYNRLWEQVTNLFVYIFGALVAYSIAYLEFLLNNPKEWTLIINNLVLPIAITLIPIAIITTILCTLLCITGKEVHDILKQHKIFN